MRTDIIIAIIVSALLHVGFAFGDKIIGLFYTPAPKVVQVDVEEKVIEIRTMPEDLIEPPEAVDSGEDVSQEQASFVPPMQADVPSPQIDNSFQQALQPPPPPTDFGQTAIAIPTGPIGPSLQQQIKIFDAKDLDQQVAVRLPAILQAPYEATREGKSGKVVVSFIVDAKGEVSNIQILESSDRIFDDAATKFVRETKFRPGRKDGISVVSRVNWPIKFDVEDD